MGGTLKLASCGLIVNCSPQVGSQPASLGGGAKQEFRGFRKGH